MIPDIVVCLELYSSIAVISGHLYTICVLLFFRNVLLVSTEMAVGPSWAAVCPVSAMVWPMFVKKVQGGVW